jgi:S1-C subfamily serine protease
VLIALSILVGMIAHQSMWTRDLERQVVREQRHIANLAELLGTLEGQTLKRGELDLLREEMSRDQAGTNERVRALEGGSTAVSQVIARSSGSVAFVQGSFGFQDPATKRALRFAVAENGDPIRGPSGHSQITLEGNGPRIDVTFTGTAFVVNRDGVLITNRHVALPWEDGTALPALQALGLEPVMRSMRGYLSGASEPFDVRFLGASDTHDVAVLQGDGAARDTSPLLLSSDAPNPGDAAILLGFPAGIRALLARAGDAFFKELSRQPPVDEDEVVLKLAQAGLVKPLASRGIVGQVSGEAIIYDAQTAKGGSGGPVLNLKGEVIAVNRAMLLEFGGSNIGVPARHALDLLEKLKINPAEAPPALARQR